MLSGNHQAALRSAQRRLNLDPLHEPTQRQLMQLFAWAGDRNAAIRQYQACRRVLDVELGLAPEEETLALHQAIQAGQVPPLVSQANQSDQGEGSAEGFASDTTTPVRHNLPSQATSFIGRQEELSQIETLIRDDPACRLLTLIGPGGIGKTRLAVQAARQAVANADDLFPDGIYFVALASISSPKALVPVIAETLNFSFYSGSDPVEQLLNFLSQKALLLVLDNLEHLLGLSQSVSLEEIEGTTELLSAIMRQAPKSKLLITSRERLNLQEEWVFEVEGLALPPSTPVEGLEAYSAIELFLQRARRARATFVLTEAEAEPVLRICRLVAGVPLGIELAAAWVRMMSCQDIAREIEQGLDFLTTSLRDVPERHQSLRTVFEQSWSHLSEEESAVFRKLSVFEGGFTLRAAERVAGATMPLLSSLVDKSLLRRTRAGRYEIHELLRQFAAEKLAVNDEERDQTKDRYADYYAVFLQQRGDDLIGHRQLETLLEILADIDNVQTAWNWAVAQRNVVSIGKALETFMLVYRLRGWFREGERVFAQAVAELRGVDAVSDIQTRSMSRQEKVVLGKLLTGQGFLNIRLGRYRAALELTQQGVNLLRQVGTSYSPDLAWGLLWLSVVNEVHRQFAKAYQTIEEFLSLYRQIDDRWGIGTALVRLGQVARRQGLFTEAQKHLRGGINLLNTIGDRMGVAYALDDLGHVMRVEGNYSEAQHYFEEALQKRRQNGDQEGIILSLKNIGDMERVIGRYAQARQRYQESLALAREIGYSLKIADSLDGLGMVARLQRDYEQADQFHQECLMIYKAMGLQQRITLCLINLGRLAHDKKQYGQAGHYLQEGLAICQQQGYDRERTSLFVLSGSS